VVWCGGYEGGVVGCGGGRRGGLGGQGVPLPLPRKIESEMTLIP
jgi:hypothetical protein